MQNHIKSWNIGVRVQLQNGTPQLLGRLCFDHPFFEAMLNM
jgi:hypothetical protein